MKIYCALICAVFALAAMLALSCKIFSQPESCKETLIQKETMNGNSKKMSLNSELDTDLWTKNNWRY
jgi:hypothetical protein